jgi:hypothetical protein
LDQILAHSARISPLCQKSQHQFLSVSTCGAWAPDPQYSILDHTSASSFCRLRIAPPVQPRYPYLFIFAIFSEFIAPLLPLVCSPSKLWSMYLYPLGCCRLNRSAIAAPYIVPCHYLLISLISMILCHSTGATEAGASWLYLGNHRGPFHSWMKC